MYHSYITTSTTLELVKMAERQSAPRQRLTRDARYQQLIATAWSLVREHGVEALTLGRLAESAGVAKPVVYDHFKTRNGLIAALYLDFDQRQEAIIDAAIDASEETLAARAKVIASTYVDCVIAQGREIPGVVGALAGAPELEQIRRECSAAFHAKCRKVLTPFASGRRLAPLRVRAMLGAAEALSYAAASGDITAAQAKRELHKTIKLLVLAADEA
jgi:AcrR family transcriptional regulator